VVVVAMTPNKTSEELNGSAARCTMTWMVNKARHNQS
jgi:hypothetical protein